MPTFKKLKELGQIRCMGISFGTIGGCSRRRYHNVVVDISFDVGPVFIAYIMSKRYPGRGRKFGQQLLDGIRIRK